MMWLNTQGTTSPQDYRNYLYTGNPVLLAKILTDSGRTPAAERLFLIKLRSHLTELIIASASQGKAEPLLSYISSMYGGSGNGAYYIMREPVGPQYLNKYNRIYAEINRQLTDIAAGGSFDEIALASVVC
jgi:hypothetical protein